MREREPVQRVLPLSRQIAISSAICRETQCQTRCANCSVDGIYILSLLARH